MPETNQTKCDNEQFTCIMPVRGLQYLIKNSTQQCGLHDDARYYILTFHSHTYSRINI